MLFEGKIDSPYNNQALYIYDILYWYVFDFYVYVCVCLATELQLNTSNFVAKIPKVQADCTQTNQTYY